MNISRHHIDMTARREPADLCVTNARIIDVFSQKIIEGRDLLIGDGLFLGFCEPGTARAAERLDARGRYLLPGLIDAHVHIESSMVTPPQFARLVIPKGTTTVIADPHEIANVAGIDGITYMLDASADLPLDVRIMLPSCVPATPFENAGATLSAESLAPLIDHARVGGLAEMMNFPGVVNADKDILEKLALARNAGKIIDGHAPMLGGTELDAYACAGVLTDHECSSPEELKDRIERGMFVLIRQGSAAKDLKRLIAGVTPENAWRCAFCTDDSSPEDVLTHGHMDKHLRLAVECGLDPLLAIRMATIFPATCYNLRGKGGIAPGYVADFVCVDDLKNFQAQEVFCRGNLTAKDGKMLVQPACPPLPAAVTSRVQIAPIEAAHFRLPLPNSRARVIGLEPHSLLTRSLEREVRTTDGCFDCEKNPGLAKIAVVERHKGSGNIGLGILEGYVAEGKHFGGAIATTIAHDSHNIVVAGDSDEDMLTAVLALRETGGGIVLVKGKKIIDQLPLPVAGLMSDQPVEKIAPAKKQLFERARQEYNIHPGAEPVMTLSFMALPVIPELKVTDQGLFDVTRFCFTPVAL